MNFSEIQMACRTVIAQRKMYQVDSKEESSMNVLGIASLFLIACGALFGASIGIFAYGADFWTSIGIGCGLGACVAVSEFSPMFD